MGRGLGTTQRAILTKLEAAGGGAFITDLCEEREGVELTDGTFDDEMARDNERARILSAVRGLERRGLVYMRRKANPERTVEASITTVHDSLFGRSEEPTQYTRTVTEGWVTLVANRESSERQRFSDFDFASIDLDPLPE